jgi:hypothetical protein
LIIATSPLGLPGELGGAKRATGLLTSWYATPSIMTLLSNVATAPLPVHDTPPLSVPLASPVPAVGKLCRIRRSKVWPSSAENHENPPVTMVPRLVTVSSAAVTLVTPLNVSVIVPASPGSMSVALVANAPPSNDIWVE